MLSAAKCLAAAVVTLSMFTTARAAEPDTPLRVDYQAQLLPDRGLARVSIRVDGPHLPDALRLRIDPLRQVNFSSEGKTSMSRGRLVWNPPRSGGSLHYDVRLEHDRDGPGKDAELTSSWALFRGGDLFPPMAIEIEPDEEAEASLTLRVPKDWSVVAPWKRIEGTTFEIEQEHRFFDRPTGWILAGKLGVTREKVAGIKLAIANPSGHRFHRLDILALLRWTLDDLVDVFPDHPKRFAIVGAGDPMWRGGLSGPDSLYVHADRPLISRDGTSPILHEMVHSFMHARAGKDGDWIVEGVAEYYSLALLRRSRTFSKRRYEKSLEKLAKKGRKAGDLRSPKADAAIAAQGAVLMAELNEKILRATGKKKSLDDVVRVLARERKSVETARFQEIVKEVAGTGFDEFFAQALQPRSSNK